MDPPLPPNWRSARAADGKEYYFNELTGETSWTVPTAPAAMTDEADAGAAPADAPAAVVVSDPWASTPVLERASGGDPKPSALADTGMRTEANRVQRTDSANTEDIQVAGFGSSNFYDSLGPGGFKLLIVLFSSVVVLIETAILVSKLQVAREDAEAANRPAEPAAAGDAATADLETESSRRLQSTSGCDLLMGGLSPDTDNTNYGVAVAAVSLALTLAFMLLAKFRPAVLARFSLPLPKNLGMLSAQQVFYGFLLLWWGPGTGVLTFHGPYRTTGNPYFACWAALLCSVLLCADAFTKMKVGIDHLKGASSSYLREMFGLFVSSLTLFFASIDFVGSGTGAYGMSLGIISAVICVLATYLVEAKKIGAPLRKGVSGVLLVLWAAAAVLLTFDSPFTSTGNGYFACWLGLACASLWVYREFFEMQVQFIDGRFKSFSCRSTPNELPVVSDSLGTHA